MGACCTCHMGIRSGGYLPNNDEVVRNNEKGSAVDSDHIITIGDCGARVRLQGSTKNLTMYTQKGRKGINQDAMTVWENFGGERGVVYCGVFDGHGPCGHKVARYVRDTLPSKLSWLFRDSRINGNNLTNVNQGDDKKIENDNNTEVSGFDSWKAGIIESFKEMDEDLEANDSVDSYCSGTTSVSLLKHGENLIIANLGDSRALLCKRRDADQLYPVQLTVDLKPNLTNEYERITKSRGRIKPTENEPSVYRVWMPDQDCPGLAMSRAFGDFCLKDFGLISVPEIYYRKLADDDEFVVLATDGIWDVLTNDEVIKIVASVRRRAMAARVLVDRAVRAWRYKYPQSKIDDCAVVILYFKKPRPSFTKSASEVTRLSLNYSELEANAPSKSEDDGLDTVLNCDVKEDEEDKATRVSKKTKAKDE